MLEIESRYHAAIEIAKTAANTANELFYQRDSLVIESKGLQDWVSNADKDVETQIRSAIAERFADDSIVGEEHDNVSGTSEYTWLIDPIDGTSSFINSIPGWCVVLAVLRNNKTVVGVIVDPVLGECFSAHEGGIAYLNDKPIKVSSANDLTNGSVAVGHCARHEPEQTLQLLERLITQGGMYYRNGSGALMLCYVAAGRLLGFVEVHMNAWDCVAGLFIIEQAGGKVLSFDMGEMMSVGGKVVAGAPGVFDALCALEASA